MKNSLELTIMLNIFIGCICSYLRLFCQNSSFGEIVYYKTQTKNEISYLMFSNICLIEELFA